MHNIDPSHPIRLAFLGCGFATRLHSKTLGKFKDVQCWYASRSAGKAREYQAKYRGQGSFDSYEAAIASPEIDAVLIATPPDSHLALTRRALQAGKHVIVEKPPFLSSGDFDTVKALSIEHGRQVMVAENYYYKPLLVTLRRIIASGMIGEVLFLHLNATKTQKTGNWRDDAALSGGGALFEGGIHWINLMANAGLTIETVEGFRPGSQDGAERSVQVVAQYREGAIGSLLYSWEVSTIFQGLRVSRIFGREGSVTFESNGIFVFVRGKKIRFFWPGLSDIAGYRGMFQDFFRALRSGEAPAFNLDLAKRDVELIEAVYESIKRKQL